MKQVIQDTVISAGNKVTSFLLSVQPEVFCLGFLLLQKFPDIHLQTSTTRYHCSKISVNEFAVVQVGMIFSPTNKHHCSIILRPFCNTAQKVFSNLPLIIWTISSAQPSHSQLSSVSLCSSSPFGRLHKRRDISPSLDVHD